MNSEFKSCSVDRCCRNAHHRSNGRRGFCQAHYARKRKYGDPLGGPTELGKLHQFIRDVATPFGGKECLIWPFGIGKGGYGQLKVGGKQSKAHRYICTVVHGEPPTPQHQAAHNCGNPTCVNPNHLEWKTPAGNMADKLIHDTHVRGERCVTAKLTEEQAREALSLKGVKTQREIAESFGVSVNAITSIHQRRNWAWLEDSV